MTITGPDLSHFQGSPNFAAIKAAGHSFVVLKATEGVGYVDPTFTANRRAAHAAGLVVGLYHFARAGSAAAEAAYFTGVVGSLQAGEFAVLDWEVPAPAGTTAPVWCKTWLDAVRGSLGVAPLIYMNQSAAAGSNWSLVAPLYGLWLARYDNAPASQTPVGYWGVPAMKQYTDVGTVPGVSGTCDVNVFYGTSSQLLAYGKGGTPAPAPTPASTVQEDDMRIIQNTDRGIALVGTGGYIGLAPGDLAWAGQMYGAPIVFATAAAFDACVSAHQQATLPTDAHLARINLGVWEISPPRPKGSAPEPWPVDRLSGIDAKTETIGATPTVDAQALATALVADVAAVSTLADALAAAIAHRLGNG